MLNGLAAIKPGAKLTPEALDVWWAAMRGWSLAEFREAAAHLAKSVEFMPSPFHFEQLRKASRPTTAEAFAIARRASRGANQCGRITNNVSSGDPIIDKAVDGFGGYGVIAMCDSDKLHFLERRFAEHYETAQDTEEVRAALPNLAPPAIRPSLRSTSGPKPVGALLDRLMNRDDHDDR
ncbi:MAG: hypothetical protein H7A18_09530 [Sinobacteraceae bacterium]|nr:hypothetical protein [Nevskiaceae bacterium]MCP5467025.1 hypothetical protein [Nevskiaceae bacterium]MCP5472300.1 hypothetical protein [Nevskiaceae bacterium]